jgi:predicted nuclease of predicted toxin-antitoxin system
LGAVKFLADVNVEKAIVDLIAGCGYDIKWIPDYDCQMRDEDLLELANHEKRTLITNDKDFGELVFLQKRLSTGIILLRLKGWQAQDKAGRFEILLTGNIDKLINHFVVMTEKKFRFIKMYEGS